MKSRLVFFGAVLFPAAVLTAGVYFFRSGFFGSQAAAASERYRTSLTRDGQGVVRYPPPDSGLSEKISDIPAFKSGSRDPFQVDLRSKDLSALDIRARLPDLLLASFDVHTRWPAALPAGFEPALFLELGKNPGLRIKELHKKGITGRGVGIAIIDQGFLVDHVEYGDRLRLFEEIHAEDETAQMHGVAAASIAAGRTVGVAPEADLYYIATGFSTDADTGKAEIAADFTWAAKSMNRILDVNRRLPSGRKIRVISMSIGWDSPRANGFKDLMDAVGRAKQDGVFVVCTTMAETYGFRIFGLSRDPRKDPDELSSYGEAWWGSLSGPGWRVLHIPIDSRTTAGPRGSTDYVFYRLGGLSWAVPWTAGLYALACQVKPDIDPRLFWEKALETGDSLELPAREPSLSEEEIERRVRKAIDDGIVRVKNQTQGQDIETVYAKIYGQWTKKDIGRMSEADFRAWSAGIVRPTILQELKPRKLETIVNPARLIEALGR
jgi:hypothetical protein